ncbi:MAG TPA: plastocyanin/azurin family copper-binding protein [Gemmatimonadaceae bacterium]|nr:plastocyanin/azurin family copper-binding protein [Gemmatimonadaceae bacterium]
MTHHRIITVLLFVAVSGTACGGKQEADRGTPAGSGAAPASVGAPPVTPTGKVVVVTMVSDAGGNYFKPADFTVHRGDVIRFTLGIGVHNVRFLPDSNAGKANLPAASELLQLPGQTYDLPVNVEPGSYYFQCDAHLALGMKGHVHVEP